MKSGLYSTFTIQSLQVSPSSQPVKTELLLQAEPAAKLPRMPKEVRRDGCLLLSPLLSCSISLFLSSFAGVCFSRV